MYSNFRESVSLFRVSEAIRMYDDICVPLTESLADYYSFIEDMFDISS